jgi:hypothetical protein
MKHAHQADVNVCVDIPTQEIEGLIDKTTEAVVKIVTVITIAHILKSWFT